MSLEILQYGNHVLKMKSKAIEAMTPDLKTLVDEMAESMYANFGIGLAAPQVGRLIRLVLIDFNWIREEENKPARKKLRVFINPEITWESEEDDSFVEGCLSVPDIDGKVYRPVRIKLRYRDLKFREKKIEADGMLARVLQHEIDHLEGILFVDRLKFTQRTMIAGKLNRLRNKTKAALKL
jgi:peptide deformylase